MASLQEDFNKAKLQADFNKAKQSHAYTGITRGGEKSDKYSDNKFASGLTGLLNFPMDVAKTVVGAADALTLNAPQTFKSMSETVAGGVQKAANYMGLDADKSYYPQAESAYDTVIGPYTDEERFWKMVAENPAKPAGDLAALLSGGAGLAGMAGKSDLASGLNKFASFADPVSLGVKTAKGIGRSVTPKGLPRWLTKKAMKVSPKMSFEAEAKIADTLLEDKLSMSKHGEGGYYDLQSKTLGMKDEITGLARQATEAGKKIRTGDTFKGLDDLLNRKMEGSTYRSDLKKAFRHEGEVLQNKGELLTPNQVLKMKRADVKKLQSMYDLNKPNPSIAEEIMEAQGHGNRAELVQAEPKIGPILKKQSELLAAKDAIENAIKRSGTMSVPSQGSGMAGMAASRFTGSGGAGMAATATKSMLDFPRVQHRLAKGIESARTNYGTSKAYHSARELNRANDIGKAHKEGKLDTLDKLLNFFKAGMSY